MSDADSPFEGVRWTTHDLDEFRKLYGEVVVPRLRAEGKDPESRPSHQWFRERGLRSFLTALRRHHDRTFGEFWAEDLGYGDDSGYDWATGHGATVDALEGFLDRRRERHDLRRSSVEAKRRRLNRYVRAYVAANGEHDLLAPVSRDAETPAYEAVDACYAAFDHLNGAGYSPRTKRRVRSVVDGWYGHLVGRRVARLNPATGLYDEFRWETPETDPARLDADHVRALVAAADAPRDRLLVVALAAWGLRAGEVAALHVGQVERDGEVPHVSFDETRKNGPGEVSLLYGLDALDDRIDELAADPEWTGYLFPSPQGREPHVTRGRVWAWFGDLAEAAGLPDDIDGERPSPQLCRRYWYDTYSDVLSAVLDGIGEVAAEQGSSDPRVVMENYLGEDRARRLRREFMRDRLAEVFEGN